jgi:hypothetical protein
VSLGDCRDDRQAKAETIRCPDTVRAETLERAKQ